jgi:hypothetical protein
MTTLLSAIKRAAFWDRGICLSCSTEFEVESDALDGQPNLQLGRCNKCGSQRTFLADMILDTLAHIEDDSEDGETVL